MALLGVISMSSYIGVEYGSDTTLSEDWKAMYHPASCQCGNHSEAAAWRVTPGIHNDNRILEVSDNDKISRVLRWRKIVKRYNPASSSVGAAINQAPGAGLKHDSSFSTIFGPPTSSIAIVNGSRLFKVNSSAGTIPRHPTSKSSSFLPPNFLASFSTQTTTGNLPIGIPNVASNKPVLSIEENIDNDIMPPPIRWKATFAGSLNNVPSKKGPCDTVLSTESLSIGSQAEGEIDYNMTTSLKDAIPKTDAVARISSTAADLAAKAPDVVAAVPPKTPSPVRLKLVLKTPPRVASTPGGALKEPILPNHKTAPTMSSLKKTSSANTTATRASTRCSKRKSILDIAVTAQEQLNILASTPASKKIKVSSKVVEAAIVAHSEATDEATSKAASTCNNKRKRSKISVNKSDSNNPTEDKLATTIARPAKRVRKSRVTMDSSQEAVMEDEIEPTATIAPRTLSRAARVARRNGEEEEEEEQEGLMALPATKRRRKFQDWADPKSEHWDVIRVLEDDSMLAKDDLLQLSTKNFSYINENTMKLKNPNKYSFSQPKAPKLIPYPDSCIPNAGKINIPETGHRSMPGPRGKERNVKPSGQASTNAPAGAEEKIDNMSGEKSDDSSPLSSPPSSISGPSITSASSVAPATPTPIKKKKCKDKADKIFKYYPDMAAKYDVLTNIDLQEETFLARPSIQLPVPDHIKAILVDDWENVTKNNQLVPLPAEYPVNKMLDEYLESEMPKRQAGSAAADILDEVVAGLKEYFDKTLGRILLYRFERVQYLEVRSTLSSTDGAELAGKGVGDVYGAEHLCRLIVTLPELIAQTNMDAQSSNRLREELTALSFWIGRNTAKYFTNEYETPSSDYVEEFRHGFRVA